MVDTPMLPPARAEDLHLRFKTLDAGRILHRFHMQAYNGVAFNGTDRGNARFSPIRDALGQIIPTIYGGSTFDCAAMETLFRNVTYAPPPKYLQQTKLAGNLYSILEVKETLQLVDLSSKALRGMGITRNELIDTSGDLYPVTRLWAEAIHRLAPTAQGLSWVSRQDDTAEAVVLFDDRIGPDALALHSPSRDVIEDDEVFNWLLDLADVIGLSIIP